MSAISLRLPDSLHSRARLLSFPTGTPRPEALLALAILLFIVGWTWPRKK